MNIILFCLFLFSFNTFAVNAPAALTKAQMSDHSAQVTQLSRFINYMEIMTLRETVHTLNFVQNQDKTSLTLLPEQRGAVMDALKYYRDFQQLVRELKHPDPKPLPVTVTCTPPDNN